MKRTNKMAIGRMISLWLVLLGCPVVLVPGFSSETSEADYAADTPLQTYTVTTDNGSGAGSLRQAIMDANANVGLDMIVFNIPGGGIHTQFATTTFPTISDPVIIDATTQPGYAGTPLIQLDDSGGSNHAFNVTANGVTIRGIDFIGFGGGTANAAISVTSNGNTIAACTFGIGGTVRSGNAIQITGSNNNIGGSIAADRNYFAQTSNVLISGGATGNRVSGNWFGVDTTGQPVTLRSGYAVRIDTSPGNFVGGSVGTTPGGSCTGQCNVIARTSGIVITGGAAATGNRVLGNFIGLLADGVTVANNSLSGVYLNGAPNNTVGGTTAAERNVVVGNGQAGILIEGAASTGNVITGNYLGVKTDGVGTATNSGYGVQMRASSASTRIGGTTAGERNIVSGGLFVATNNNVIQGNFIGTDFTGMNRGTTQGTGILMGGSNNTIGGTVGTTLGGPCTGACNVISGNGVDGLSSGIDIEGGTGNTIDGNYIGLNAAGTAAILNGITPGGGTYLGYAILLNNASNNTIGRLSGGFAKTERGVTERTPNEPSTLVCIQDHNTGDYLEYQDPSGNFETRHCASGQTLSGVGDFEALSGGNQFFESAISVPGDVRAISGQNRREARIIFPSGLVLDLDDTSSNSTCECGGPNQVIAGPAGFTGTGSDSNNNVVANDSSGYAADGATQLNIPRARAGFEVSFGNDNQFFELHIDAGDQPGIAFQHGTNNVYSDVDIRQLVPGVPVVVGGGANGGQQPPTVVIQRAVTFLGAARITGTVTGPANTMLRIRLYGIDLSEFAPNGEQTSDLDLSFDVMTDGSGVALIDELYTDTSGDAILHHDSLSASASVLIGGVVGPGSTMLPAVPGNTSALSSPVPVPKPRFDLDGDGRTDLTVCRPGTLSYWYTLNSFDNSARAVQFGTSGDMVVPGDYHGTLTMDHAVWRPSNGTWYVSGLTSPSTNYVAFVFGVSTDTPVTGDFDGDGRGDPAVYRNGDWWIRQSLSQTATVQHFGLAGDKPVPADYNGDGRTDVAIYRNGLWAISSCAACSVSFYQFGTNSDIPVPGDFDGDGKADVGVFRSSTGVWYLQQSTAGFAAYQWGANGDVPINGDFDGDGKNDISIWRASTGDFWILQSSNGQVRGVHWGQNGDIPVAKF